MRPGIWLAVCSVLLVLQAGCRGEHVNANTPTRGQGAAAEGQVEERAPQPAGVGEVCALPADCPGYLWCVDERCEVPAAVENEPGEDTPRVHFKGESGEEISFFTELALTPSEHEKGLMFRRSLPDDWSMLFVYPEEGARSFWMQNTFIPLDMIFISAAGEVVNIVREAEPLTRTPRRSTGPARFVLEIRGGLAAELGLKAGQRISVENIPAEHSPGR